jgi:hypothetical protein
MSKTTHEVRDLFSHSHPLSADDFAKDRKFRSDSAPPQI